MTDNTPVWFIAGILICLTMFSCDLVDATKKQTEALQQTRRELYELGNKLSPK